MAREPRTAPKIVIAAVSAAAALLAGPAMAAQLDLDLANQTARDLEEFYAAPAGSGAWGEDILGAAFLPAGNQVTITVADDDTTCIYDLRFVFSDGDAAEEAGVDVCAAGSYALTE